MVLDASEMEDKTYIKKILVVLPNWIGDAVMSLPAIYSLREKFPFATIAIIGLPHICELFYESPYADEIRVYKKDSPSNKGGLRGICRICGTAELVAAGFSLRSGQYDLALLLPNSFSSALLVWLAGIPNRCGYNRDARGFLLTMPVRLTPEIKKLHQMEYYLYLAKSFEDNRLAKAVVEDASNESKAKNVLPVGHENVISAKAGIQNGGRGLDSHLRGNDGQLGKSTSENQGKIGALLYLSKDEIQQAKEILAKYQITPHDLLIGINPGAAYGSSKRWHPERFGQVAATLVTKYHAKVILFGGPDERVIAEEIVRASGASLLNMAGQTTIRGLMALLNQCRLLITNDSGPMHITAALGVPVVAIFGSTDPSITAPSGSRHVVIKKDVPCSPCFRRECPTDMECMDLIEVEDVLGGVETILGPVNAGNHGHKGA